MSIQSDGPEKTDPIGVSPKEAQRLLSIGNTKCYEMMNAGVLEYYKEGAATRITMVSIRRHVARQLEAARGA
jgi:hypothetical protein